MSDAETTVERSAVKLDRDLIQKAKHIATAEGCSITDVIEQEARAGIDRRYKRVITRAAAELGGES